MQARLVLSGALLHVDKSFRVVRFDPISRVPHSPLQDGPASNIPTLNFAKNAKFRMGHLTS